MNSNKFQQLLESMGMLTRQQRLFYPRNFKLSRGFIEALKQEIEIQARAGLDPDQFVIKLNKALQFYVADYKRINSTKRAQPVDIQPNRIGTHVQQISNPSARNATRQLNE